LEGSTGWAEDNADWLRSHAIAYINTDTGVTGTSFDAAGTPSLTQLVIDTTSDCPLPSDPSKKVRDSWNATQLDVLGSGSDFTVFLDHLGIPSLDLSYDNSTRAGVYHSIYDSFYWMEHFGDPGYLYHAGLAQFLGVVLLRLVDSPTLPFNYTNYASQLAYYLTIVQAQNGTSNVNFSALQTAISEFGSASAVIDTLSTCAKAGTCASAVDLTSLNARLRLSERRLLINALTNTSDGLPGRPWYKHVVQAPGIYQGYGAVTFPSIAESLNSQNWELAQQQILRVAASIGDAAFALTEVSASSTLSTPRCFGDSLGAVNLTPAGGFSPLSYSLDGTSWQLSPSFQNLTAGTYIVQIRDAQNFITNVTVNITQPAKIEINVSFNGSSASAHATGGTGPYVFVWSTGESNTSISLVDGATYNVTAIDADGCKITETFSYRPNDHPNNKLSPGAIVGIVLGVLIGLGIIAGVGYYTYKRHQRIKRYENL